MVILCLYVCLPPPDWHPPGRDLLLLFSEYLVEDSDVIELSVCCVNGPADWVVEGEDKKIKYSPVLLTYVVLMWNNLVDGGYHYYYRCWYNHTHELSNVCIEWTLWVLAAHNLVSFLRVVWPSFSSGEHSSPTLNPCDLERASLLGAKNGRVTQTWPISAAQSPGYSWFSNGHMTRAKLMKLDLRTFARDIEEEELFSAGLAKLAEFSL